MPIAIAAYSILRVEQSPDKMNLTLYKRRPCLTSFAPSYSSKTFIVSHRRHNL